MQGGIGAMYWDKLYGAGGWQKCYERSVEVTAALLYRRLEGDSADVLWISLKEKHAYRQKQVGRLGSTLLAFVEMCFDVLLPASSIQTGACVIKSSMHSLPIIHVSGPTAITTTSSSIPQWRWWSWWWDGQSRETIWEDMHALDVWRARRRRRVRVGNVALLVRLRPGCRSRANVSGPAADGVTYPRAARHILKPSPGCLRGARGTEERCRRRRQMERSPFSTELGGKRWDEGV